jgi:alkylhydroperoxidase/carboxymuconolactone decarboxylase family protein YurZ
VRAALKAGLSREEILRALEEAETVRREGGVAVANVGRTMLGLGAEAQGEACLCDASQALVYIGSAAGCNAGGLLARYLEAASGLGLSAEELAEAVQVAQAVKEKGAMGFFARDVERALGKLAPAAAAAGGSGPTGRPTFGPSCCGPGCG